jgi:hypothetical protein
MTDDELRAIVREQLEWCEVLHQLVPGATVQEAISSGQVAVYVTAGAPPKPTAPPPHRYLYVVSAKPVDQAAYAAMLKEESGKWNALDDAGRLAAAEARAGTKWEKWKLINRLSSKGFRVRGIG